MLVMYSINGKKLILSDEHVRLLAASLEASTKSLSNIAKMSSDEFARDTAIELASLLGQLKEIDKDALSNVSGNQTGLPGC